jgi:hypothetical protein
MILPRTLVDSTLLDGEFSTANGVVKQRRNREQDGIKWAQRWMELHPPNPTKPDLASRFAALRHGAAYIILKRV